MNYFIRINIKALTYSSRFSFVYLCGGLQADDATRREYIHHTSNAMNVYETYSHSLSTSIYIALISRRTDLKHRGDFEQLLFWRKEIMLVSVI